MRAPHSVSWVASTSSNRRTSALNHKNTNQLRYDFGRLKSNPDWAGIRYDTLSVGGGGLNMISCSQADVFDPQCCTQQPPYQPPPPDLVHLSDLTSRGDDDEFLSSSWQIAQRAGLNKGRCELPKLHPSPRQICPQVHCSLFFMVVEPYTVVFYPESYSFWNTIKTRGNWWVKNLNLHLLVSLKTHLSPFITHWKPFPAMRTPCTLLSQ